MKSPEDTRQEIEQQLNFSTDNDMVEAVAYNIWGAAVTTTRAFKKVQVRIDPGTQRVFVVVQLRYLANRMERFHEFWIKRCEDKCRKFIPAGWKILTYYGRGGKDGYEG
jgi:hypothetical protein